MEKLFFGFEYNRVITFNHYSKCCFCIFFLNDEEDTYVAIRNHCWGIEEFGTCTGKISRLLLGYGWSYLNRGEYLRRDTSNRGLPIMGDRGMKDFTKTIRENIPSKDIFIVAETLEEMIQKIENSSKNKTPTGRTKAFVAYICNYCLTG
jgi:hypothetical protein